MESITLLLAFETAGESRQSAKHTPQAPNQPDPNNVPLPHT
jgi:hypothetical protein